LFAPTHEPPMTPLDINLVPTPAYVLEEEKLRHNLAILDRVQRESGAKIILALKGFAFWSAFPWIREVLHGATASSLNEARLAHEEFGRETHVYSVAFTDAEFPDILKIADHIVFNSFSQWRRFRDQVKASPRTVHCGIRVNPGHSEIKTPLYDPCFPGSRLGVTPAEFRPDELDGVSGLHFHAHCGNNSDTLERVVESFEKLYGEYIPRMKWINFGGGHHITREDYDVDRLIRVAKAFREKWGVEVYLEPGEAVGWRTGPLVSSVVDIVRNGAEIAILDTSATAHMPDTLEMPYRPEIRGAAEPGVLPHTYRLGGLTCLAGDVIGDYSFAKPLQIGDRLVFEDMIHYTIVKNTTFNGVNLPSLCIWTKEGQLRVVKKFGYESYRDRNS
jgi:carboxynorspermidine decarboxylase